ncbi:hypothetical protein TorRG33x02_087380 [Trema orientale]|uniref:Endonuclease/exonuclease/phosphatase n=1 Tax=Trema orientale TaxID=63057 RepID=A0A2P5FCS4_TREOI|nr:hypothetical protein TorRG33x02_087380 [Trema orientale]
MEDYNRIGESNLYLLSVWGLYTRAWVHIDLAFPLKHRVKVRLRREADCFWAEVKDEQVVIPKPLRKISESIACGLSERALIENTRVDVNQNLDDGSNHDKILEVSNEGFSMSSNSSIKTSITRNSRLKKIAWTVGSGRSVSSYNVHLRKRRRKSEVWRVRGLESLRLLHKLWDLLHITSPNLVFLIETKLYGSKARKVVSRLGYDGHIVVDSKGISDKLNQRILHENLFLFFINNLK